MAVILFSFIGWSLLTRLAASSTGCMIMCLRFSHYSLLFLKQVDSYLRILGEPKLPSSFLQVVMCCVFSFLPKGEFWGQFIQFHCTFRSYAGFWVNTGHQIGSILLLILSGNCVMWQRLTQGMTLSGYVPLV